MVLSYVCLLLLRFIGKGNIDYSCGDYCKNNSFRNLRILPACFPCQTRYGLLPKWIGISFVSTSFNNSFPLISIRTIFPCTFGKECVIVNEYKMSRLL